MDEVIIRYQTTTNTEKTRVTQIDEIRLNLDLRDIVEIDLLPLIWCTKLEKLTIQHNHMKAIDLTPLSKCVNLEILRLSNNQLTSIDLEPLSDCPHLSELDLTNNAFRTIDLSPLFHCSELAEIKFDDSAVLTADLLLRSIGSWPDVLVDKFHKILWKASEP
ncbi:MAG: leucine-rich repeat domain-containing protein [Candidatus Thorarchaeota archaeon]|nr:leucine-rich repeat domain-containing protein [Candidatus Thorarchaeota archaeon]